MPKFYIPDFYIKSFFLSCLALMLLTAIVSLIIDNISSIYIGGSIAILIGIFGLISIGYFNASYSSKEQSGKPLYLHLFIISILFIISAIWSEASIFRTLLRELAYLIFLQLGVYFYCRKNRFSYLT